MVEDDYELNELFVYERKSSRLELFVRIFYGIPVAIIIAIYGIIAGLCMMIQWIVILILGRRSEGLNEFIKGYLEYYVHIMSYFSYMTDQRPGITPKKVQIFEVIEEED
jgi:amino acid permease